VLCNSKPDGAIRRADEVRKNIEKYDFIYRDHRIPVTISGGISVFDINKEKKTPEKLIREADEALYMAKRTGRNRIATYAPL